MKYAIIELTVSKVNGRTIGYWTLAIGLEDNENPCWRYATHEGIYPTKDRAIDKALSEDIQPNRIRIASSYTEIE
jgi:hypothetical protein